MARFWPSVAEMQSGAHFASDQSAEALGTTMTAGPKFKSPVNSRGAFGRSGRRPGDYGIGIEQAGNRGSACSGQNAGREARLEALVGLGWSFGTSQIG